MSLRSTSLGCVLFMTFWMSALHAGAAVPGSHQLNLAEANKLVALPLNCIEKPYPYKVGWVLRDAEDLKPPSVVHPVFNGCYDWHSAVHAYWSLVTLARQLPELEKADAVRSLLRHNLTPQKVAKELAFFRDERNASFERTYGWAWLLKLQLELQQWKDPLAEQLAANLRPLSDLIAQRYLEFLPRLVYPVRVGVHGNTAFGLSFAFDYATHNGNSALQSLISKRARDFYMEDRQCPIAWEPSGYDFLSPCLEEMGLMQRVLPEKLFLTWLQGFLPQLADPDFTIDTAEVGDRTDGKLVHLDGLNFSRAWNLYLLANRYPQYAHLKDLADRHVAYSYPNLIGDSYEGGHWLGSFAIHALNTSRNQQE
ncbi:DUF2891 domain-containing protein [Allohahella sp. A8]|uniref:DUF2891 domain-containing protein n=1 Tax=Allohahella sp. A8 TaxID=3141461 RepID=UPI003A7FC2BC